MASMTIKQRLAVIASGQHLDLADIVAGDALKEITRLEAGIKPGPSDPSTAPVGDAAHWKKLRNLLGLDGWYDGIWQGVATPAEIVVHVQHVAEERARLLKAALTAGEKAGAVGEQCPDCSGSGSHLVSVAGCCGNGTKTGECCGNAIEVPGEEACNSCGGTGIVPPTTTATSCDRLARETINKCIAELNEQLTQTYSHYGRVALKGAIVRLLKIDAALGLGESSTSSPQMVSAPSPARKPHAMTDLVKRLREQISDGHAKGCDGRSYHCDCGFDIATEGLLELAASALESLSAKNAALKAERDVLKNGTRMAYEAMKKAIKLCQVNLKTDDWQNEDASRRSLRLEIFAALDLPLAVVGNTERGRGDGEKLIGNRLVEAESRNATLLQQRNEAFERAAKVADDLSEKMARNMGRAAANTIAHAIRQLQEQQE